VQNLVQDGGINLTVGAQQIGILDPAPGVSKALRVTYKINGKNNLATVDDGNVFSLDAPSLGSGSQTANQAVGGIFLKLLGSVGNFLGFFLLFFISGMGYALFGGVNGDGMEYLGVFVAWFLLAMSPFLLPILWVPLLMGFFGWKIKTGLPTP